MHTLDALKEYLPRLTDDEKISYLYDLVWVADRYRAALLAEKTKREFPIGTRVYMDNTSSLYIGTIAGHERTRILVKWDGDKRVNEERGYTCDDLTVFPSDPTELLNSYFLPGTKYYMGSHNPEWITDGTITGWTVDKGMVFVHMTEVNGKKSSKLTNAFTVSNLSSRKEIEKQRQAEYHKGFHNMGQWWKDCGDDCYCKRRKEK